MQRFSNYLLVIIIKELNDSRENDIGLFHKRFIYFLNICICQRWPIDLQFKCLRVVVLVDHYMDECETNLHRVFSFCFTHKYLITWFNSTRGFLIYSTFILFFIPSHSTPSSLPSFSSRSFSHLFHSLAQTTFLFPLFLLWFYIFVSI